MNIVYRPPDYHELEWWVTKADQGGGKENTLSEGASGRVKCLLRRAKDNFWELLPELRMKSSQVVMTHP